MANIITKIIAIIPAHSAMFYFEGIVLRPVAYFAHVEYVDPEFSSLGIKERIIAVGITEYSEELVGAKLDHFLDRDLVHKDKLTRSLE